MPVAIRNTQKGNGFHPKGTSSHFVLRAPRRLQLLGMTNKLGRFRQ